MPCFRYLILIFSIVFLANCSAQIDMDIEKNLPINFEREASIEGKVEPFISGEEPETKDTVETLVPEKVSEAQPEAEKYFIDIAQESIEISCKSCPNSVGQMIIARPLKIGEIEKSEDIIIETCQFTLVAPDLVQTAAHCADRWTRGDWKEKANGDCSKVFGFFFAGKDGLGESARCLKIESPIQFDRKKHHTQPDSLLIRLDKKLEALFPKVGLELTKNSQGEYKIWGALSDKKTVEERSCDLVEASVLSPLRAVGLTKTPYFTLTCDGPIVKGWSGAGVFKNGKLVGNISQTYASTNFDASQFGTNEVVVSGQRCAPDFMNPSVSPSAECYSTFEEFISALQETYFRSFDLSTDWQNLVVSLLNKNFPALHYNYYSELQSKAIIKERTFTLGCVDETLLPPKDSIELVYEVRVVQEKLKPKFVNIDQKTRVQGLWAVKKPVENLGSFSNPLDFKKALFEKNSKGVKPLDPDLLKKRDLIPYCSHR